MQLAIVAAGFTPGEADQLRRAMARLAAQRRAWSSIEQKLMDGMRANGYSRKSSPSSIYRADPGLRRVRLSGIACGVASRCWPTSRAGSSAITRPRSAPALLNSQPMGFYPPAQLVWSRRSATACEILPVDVTASEYPIARWSRARAGELALPGDAIGQGFAEGRSAAHRRCATGAGVCFDSVEVVERAALR